MSKKSCKVSMKINNNNSHTRIIYSQLDGIMIRNPKRHLNELKESLGDE